MHLRPVPADAAQSAGDLGHPDVRIFLNGVEQYTYDLTVSTVYDVEVTVHNASRDKPALGTAVDIAWIEFGAGAQTRHPIAFRPTCRSGLAPQPCR